jgi:hypothetical protein
MVKQGLLSVHVVGVCTLPGIESSKAYCRSDCAIHYRYRLASKLYLNDLITQA